MHIRLFLKKIQEKVSDHRNNKIMTDSSTGKEALSNDTNSLPDNTNDEKVRRSAPKGTMVI